MKGRMKIQCMCSNIFVVVVVCCFALFCFVLCVFSNYRKIVLGNLRQISMCSFSLFPVSCSDVILSFVTISTTPKWAQNIHKHTPFSCLPSFLSICLMPPLLLKLAECAAKAVIISAEWILLGWVRYRAMFVDLDVWWASAQWLDDQWYHSHPFCQIWVFSHILCHRKWHDSPKFSLFT